LFICSFVHLFVCSFMLLPALQLADSFFPTGMFTQSHGLERYVELGVRGEAAIAALVESYILHAAGPAEALAARWACRAAQQPDLALVEQIDRRLDASKLAQEPREASRRCGGRILLLGAELFPDGIATQYLQQHAPGHQAIALALIAADSGLDEEAATLVELHSYTVSLVSAAVRLGAIDHITAQKILVRMQPIMLQAATLGHERNWQQIGSFAPEIDLMQMQHQYALAHMFVS
jgi:urease accessory protein